MSYFRERKHTHNWVVWLWSVLFLQKCVDWAAPLRLPAEQSGRFPDLSEPEGGHSIHLAADTLQSSSAPALSRRQTSHTSLSWVKTRAITGWHKSKHNWTIRDRGLGTCRSHSPELLTVYLTNALFSWLNLIFFRFGYKALGLYKPTTVYRNGRSCTEEVESTLIEKSINTGAG